MNKEQLNFLLKYAKKGVLSSMTSLDVIEQEELKREFIDIKASLTKDHFESNKGPSIESKDGKKKSSAVKNWLSGIGDRQRKYQETHKDELY
jgi:hypothetical protein